MKKISLFLLMFLGTWALAQKVKLVSGNFDFLKDQKEVSVKFDFSPMKFYKENIDEQTYIQRRQKEISAAKGNDEASKWLADWEHTKSVTIPHKFLASWEKYGHIKGTQASGAKYTLLVKTVWVYPGWFAGVMNQPSKVSTNLVFVETAAPSKVLAEVECINAPGDNFVGLPNNNDRIAEAYAKTSKELAQLINKKLK